MWPESHDPLNFGGLNANSSKTAKAMDFKFDTLVPRDSANTTLNFFPKGDVARSRDPLNFWKLNAYISKTVKGIDFKFDAHVYRDSPDKTLKIFPKWGVTRVT